MAGALLQLQASGISGCRRAVTGAGWEQDLTKSQHSAKLNKSPLGLQSRAGKTRRLQGSSTECRFQKPHHHLVPLLSHRPEKRPQRPASQHTSHQLQACSFRGLTDPSVAGQSPKRPLCHVQSPPLTPARQVLPSLISSRQSPLNSSQNNERRCQLIPLATPTQQGEVSEERTSSENLPVEAKAQTTVDRVLESSNGRVKGDEVSTGELEYLVRRGRWAVRKAGTGELRAVAAVQARAFHEPPPLPFLDPWFLALFEAEIYEVLRSKAKNNTSRSYTCLLATPYTPESDDDSSGEMAKGEGTSGHDWKVQGRDGTLPVKVVGVVDATCLEEPDVVRHLPESTTQYLYLTGMGVDPAFRRERVGSLLLEAAEKRARQLGLKHVALHVHTDNLSARTFYSQAGFVEIAKDMWWTTALLGMKQRILMAKFLDESPSPGEKGDGENGETEFR